jgi:hypothetical protein
LVQSEIKYGQIAGNKHINETIYRCFEHICAKDVPKFVKKFRRQLNDNTQVMHTFRELVLGAYLASRGYGVKYEYELDGKTPDWCLVDKSLAPTAIVEVINFHLDRATEGTIESQLQLKNLWVGWQGPNDARLYQRIGDKAIAYKALVEHYCIPYIVALYGEFTAAVHSDELSACLYDPENGLFQLHPKLSGLLYFEEQSGRYQFTYTPNPDSCNPHNVPSGDF